MTQNGYITITLPPAARWLAATVVIATATFAAVMCARWTLAESILQIARTEPIPPYMLETAYSLQPGNPEAAYALGLYTLDQRQPPDVDRAMQLLDKAVELAPNRPELWLGVAHARELAADTAGAEAAIRRASALAPGHLKTDWMLANLDIRDGRLQDAIPAMLGAVQTKPDLAPLAVRTLWAASQNDVVFCVKATADSLSCRSALATLLLSQHRVDDAAAIWPTLAPSAANNTEIATLGYNLAQGLFEANRNDQAIEILETVRPGSVPAVGVVANGSFNEPFLTQWVNQFSWSITQSKEVRVTSQPGRDGTNALGVDFSSPGGQNLSVASETVRVVPGKPYLLAFWASSRNLVTGGLPHVEIGGVSQVMPGGTTEWTQYEVRFQAPASGLTELRIARRSCGDVCPIYGTLLVDDFTLRQLSTG